MTKTTNQNDKNNKTKKNNQFTIKYEKINFYFRVIYYFFLFSNKYMCMNMATKDK